MVRDDLVAQSKTRMLVEPQCPFCSWHMVFRHSVLAQGPLAECQLWKCPRCHFGPVTFCIPLDAATWAEEKALRGGVHLSPYRDGDAPEVNRGQLEALGYMEWEDVEAAKRRRARCQ